MADPERTQLDVLLSIDSKLDRLPDYPSLLEAEKQERKDSENRFRRILIALGITVLVLAVTVVVVGWLFARSVHDRHAADAERARTTTTARCAIREAIAKVVHIETMHLPAGSRGAVLGDRIVTDINRALPAHCPGG